MSRPARLQDEGETVPGFDIATLNSTFADRPTREMLGALLLEIAPGRTAVIASFGTETAVMLQQVARIDPATPVLFLDTGKLFDETLRYRDELIAHFGLSDVRSLTPEPLDLKAEDPEGDLWSKVPDRCCAIRKTWPLDRALEGFDARITGRKRFQAATRKQIDLFEQDRHGRLVANPLAHWSAEDIQDAFLAFDLPRHPLEAQGYRSIGCAPCTAPVAANEDARAGRWRGLDKIECGIHFDI